VPTGPAGQPGAPGFHADPVLLDFGHRLPLDDHAPPRTVTVTNAGSAPLRISRVSVDGPATPADYTITGDTCSGSTIAPGARCRITVTFNGHGAGNRSAVLRFDDNMAGGVNLVGLRAAVLAPRLLANPGVSPPGRTTTVSGQGFPPDHSVTVRSDASVKTTRVRTDSAGNFSTDVLIFPKSDPGGRTITASVDGVHPKIAAEAPLLVVRGSLQPPGLLIRH